MQPGELMDHRVSSSEYPQAMTDELVEPSLVTDDPVSASPQGMLDSRELSFIAVSRTRMPMVATDPRQADNPIVLANNAFLQATGYSAAEVIGRNCRFLQGPVTDPHAIAEVRDAVASARELTIDLLNYRKDGSTFWNRLFISPVHDDDGNLVYFFASLFDVTEQLRAAARLQKIQSELIHLSRVGAMESLASTLAHELNQPMTAVVNYIRGSQRMMAQLAGNDRIDAVLEALAEAGFCAARAGETIRRLRDMVTRGDVQRQREDLPSLIKEACSLAMIDASALGIRYRFEFDPAALVVFADRIQIQQVLINLLRNATDALKSVEPREIVVSTRKTGKFCEVLVSDTGPGIAPMIEQRLFSPFNTTKTDGLGLGLSISRTIIEAHGGQIWSESNEKGAIFHFTLSSV